MLFQCLKFAVRDQSTNLAMAKSSFKLEHPLGMLFISFLAYLIGCFIQQFVSIELFIQYVDTEWFIQQLAILFGFSGEANILKNFPNSISYLCQWYHSLVSVAKVSVLNLKEKRKGMGGRFTYFASRLSTQKFQLLDICGQANTS